MRLLSLLREVARARDSFSTHEWKTSTFIFINIHGANEKSLSWVFSSRESEWERVRPLLEITTMHVILPVIGGAEYTPSLPNPPFSIYDSRCLSGSAAFIQKGTAISKSGALEQLHTGSKIFGGGNGPEFNPFNTGLIMKTDGWVDQAVVGWSLWLGCWEIDQLWNTSLGFNKSKINHISSWQHSALFFPSSFLHYVTFGPLLVEA